MLLNDRAHGVQHAGHQFIASIHVPHHNLMEGPVVFTIGPLDRLQQGDPLRVGDFAARLGQQLLQLGFGCVELADGLLAGCLDVVLDLQALEIDQAHYVPSRTGIGGEVLGDVLHIALDTHQAGESHHAEQDEQTQNQQRRKHRLEG